MLLHACAFQGGSTIGSSVLADPKCCDPKMLPCAAAGPCPLTRPSLHWQRHTSLTSLSSASSSASSSKQVQSLRSCRSAAHSRSPARQAVTAADSHATRHTPARLLRECCHAVRCYAVCCAAANTKTGRAAVSNYFYILGHERHAYQAPSLHAAITARLQRSMHHVREGFKRFKVRAPWCVVQLLLQIEAVACRGVAGS